MAPILGALFAILIGLLAIRPYLDYQQQSFENIEAANTASQFRQIIDAAETYVQANCLPSGSSGTIVPACQNIPLSQLPAGGYLPSATNLAKNPYGQQWNLIVTNNSGSVVALLYSSGGRAIPTRLAAQIAAETGQEGGFVPPVNLNSIYGLSTNGQLGAVGAYGHWILSPLLSYLPANSGIAPGDLIALLDITTEGSGAVANNDYLYRTAVQGDNGNSLNTMDTNLGMNGHAIQNAGSVNVTTSLPQSKTPFLAQMVGTTANKNPGGMVETTDASGDTAIMETDSTGSTLALTNKSQPSTLSLSDNVNANDSLKLISSAQTAGANCSKSQIGTIAPDVTGSGLPVVCTKQVWGLSISPSSTAYTSNVSYSFGAGSNSAIWQSVGVGETMSQIIEFSPYPQFYINNTPKPLFIASDCDPAGGLLGGGGSIEFTLQAPKDAQPGQYSVANSSSSMVGLGGFSAAPALSVIIPPGFTFNYATTGVGSCKFMVTY